MDDAAKPGIFARAARATAVHADTEAQPRGALHLHAVTDAQARGARALHFAPWRLRSADRWVELRYDDSAQTSTQPGPANPTVV